MTTQFTVVTISKDNQVELAQTLLSVSQQTHPPTLHLVIDSSLRPSVEANRALSAKHGANYLWTPPNGIYAAMRHAIPRLPDSGYCLFVNAGDFLANHNSLRILDKSISESPTSNTNWLIGGLLLRGDGVQDTEYFVPSEPESFSRKLVFEGLSLPHPSTVYLISALRQVSPFEDRYRISTDYATALRMFMRFGPPKVVSEIISSHTLGGISSQRIGRSLLENAHARLKTFGIRVLVSEVKLFLRLAWNKAIKKP